MNNASDLRYAPWRCGYVLSIMTSVRVVMICCVIPSYSGRLRSSGATGTRGHARNLLNPMCKESGGGGAQDIESRQIEACKSPKPHPKP